MNVRAVGRAIFRTKFLGVLVIVALLALWQIATATGMIKSSGLPQVTAIVRAWWRLLLEGDLLRTVWSSVRRMLIGYGLAGIVGTTLGILIGRVRFLLNAIEPLVELLRPLPSPAYVPVVILFLGIDDSMKVFLVFFASIFPVLINTYSGVLSVDRTLTETARTFGLSEVQTMREVIIPAAAPFIFTGLRVSLAIALIITIISEMIAGNDGMGYLVLSSQSYFRVPEMYAGIATLAIVGYSLNRIFLVIERRVIGWHFAAND